MSKPKLTYFDMAVSRGEECRLALTCAGVEFEDVRLTREQWLALKPSTPYGSLPTLEIDGAVLAHSNAILVYIGRRWGLHPTDALEAARHEAVMCHVEDLRLTTRPILHIQGEEERRAARQKMCEGLLPTWASFAEKQIKGPFFGGDTLQVADLKLYMLVRWFASGTVDHVPATIFADFRKLTGVFEAVGNDPRVKAWVTR